MKVILQTLFLVVTACCFAGSMLHAQTVADSLQLPEVVVTEKYIDREIRSTAPLQLLTQKNIRQLPALQVSDAIKYFSGVTVKDYGGIGGLKTVSVRSMGANHTAVSYDGITITDVQSGQIDIGRFSLQNVDVISLNNGQSDVIFQPARLFASASVLTIQTQTPRFNENEKINGTASLKVGSFGLMNPSFHTNLKLSDKWSSSFSGEWMSANGKYPYVLQYGEAGKDSSSVERRENTDVTNLRLESALHARFSEKSKGNMRLYYYRSERGLPGATIYYNTENFSKQRLWDYTFFGQAHFEHNFSRKWVMQANAKYNHGYLRYLDPTFLGEKGTIDDVYNQDEIYGSLAALFRAFERISFSVSSDMALTSMHSNREHFDTPSRLTSQSVFAGKYVSNQFLATASILYTHTNESTKEGEPADNQQKFSPYVSISVKPFYDIDLRIRAFYKNIFRLPTFNDLYYPSIGKRTLKPEDANQFNLGATYATRIAGIVPLFSISVDGYRNRVKNQIVAYPTGNVFQWTMMNLGIVETTGVDVSAETAFAISPKANIVFSGAYTYQKAVDKTNPEKSTYGHQIPYTPRKSGSGRVVLELPWCSIAYSALWSGVRYYNGYNSKEYRLNGYSDHSVTLSKSVNSRFGKLNFTAEALNILNKNYEIVRNYPMPGRSFRISILYHF